MLNSLKNRKGFSSVYALLFLVLVTLGGTSMIMVSRRDRTNSDAYLKMKSASQAAMSSLDACESRFLNDPMEAYTILTKYTEDNNNVWLLNSSSNTSSEVIYEMFDGNDASKYSARIIGFDPSSFLIKIEGRGYGRYGGMKKAVASYQLNGLGAVASSGSKYALYLKKDGYDFNQFIEITGDVYFGGGVRFNSNATGTVIDGNLKTANSNTVSEFNGGITVKKNVFFQTPVKLQNASITIEGNAGFDKYVQLFKNMYIKEDAYFNGQVYENNKIDMNNKKVLHSGSCSSSKFVNYSSFTPNGGTIDIPSKMDIPPNDHDDPITVNIDDIPSMYIKSFASLGFTEFTGKNLQSTYANTPSSELYKGYLVVRIGSSDPEPTFYVKEGAFQGKIILIVERSLSVNGKWYSSCITSETLLHVRNGGAVYQLGWDNLLRGYINVSGSGLVHYAFNSGSVLKGAIHHVSDGAGFQANSSNFFKLTYDESLMSSLKSAGLISSESEEAEGNVTFKLIDAKIRPQLLSVQQI